MARGRQVERPYELTASEIHEVGYLADRGGYLASNLYDSSKDEQDERARARRRATRKLTDQLVEHIKVREEVHGYSDVKITAYFDLSSAKTQIEEELLAKLDIADEAVEHHRNEAARMENLLEAQNTDFEELEQTIARLNEELRAKLVPESQWQRVTEDDELRRLRREAALLGSVGERKLLEAFSELETLRQQAVANTAIVASYRGQLRYCEEIIKRQGNELKRLRRPWWRKLLDWLADGLVG
jgi:hypothetical protein